ncbi:hypothetical protein J6590_061931 [Homalodisca vitripennis]|nr:hypothetical protein J6590_061931 [Homalodisca vitripennis]
MARLQDRKTNENSAVQLNFHDVVCALQRRKRGKSPEIHGVSWSEIQEMRSEIPLPYCCCITLPLQRHLTCSRLVLICHT